jgi:hypothetical protein
MRERGGDFEAGFIGDNRDPFGGLHAQAHADSIARARRQLRVERKMIELAGGMAV